MKPYIPQDLPLKCLDFRRLIGRVGKANAALARYDGLLQGIVNPDILLSPLTNEEAVLSSRLEGTQATVDEVYEHEAGIEKNEEKTKDIQEIVNYRLALRMGQEQLRAYPISLPFVREIHKVLMNSVRGQTKSPGEFRPDQNWIGLPGSSIEQASFIPPSPICLQEYLDAWITYLSTDDIDPLIQTAIMHAQFELIHPFKDGNGRIGRLLIPLFLFQKKCLNQPMFYLSSYLEANRDEYCSTLGGISQRGDWNSWIDFFLEAVIKQADSNIRKVKNIISLYDEMKDEIQRVTHSQFSLSVLDGIFKRPIFKASDFVGITKIQRSTALGLLGQLKDHGILQEIRPSRGRTPAILAFSRLLNIAEGREVV